MRKSTTSVKDEFAEFIVFAGVITEHAAHHLVGASLSSNNALLFLVTALLLTKGKQASTTAAIVCFYYQSPAGFSEGESNCLRAFEPFKIR